MTIFQGVKCSVARLGKAGRQECCSNLQCLLSSCFTLFIWNMRLDCCGAFSFTRHTFPFIFKNAVWVCHKRRPIRLAFVRMNLSYCLEFVSWYSYKKCTQIFAFCFADVIHTVGPIARGNVGLAQKEALASCYKSSLKLVKDNSLRSVVSTEKKKKHLSGFTLAMRH